MYLVQWKNRRKSNIPSVFDVISGSIKLVAGKSELILLERYSSIPICSRKVSKKEALCAVNVIKFSISNPNGKYSSQHM